MQFLKLTLIWITLSCIKNIAKEGKGYLPAEVLEVYHSVVEMILLRRSLKIAEKLQALQEVLK